MIGLALKDILGDGIDPFGVATEFVVEQVSGWTNPKVGGAELDRGLGVSGWTIPHVIGAGGSVECTISGIGVSGGNGGSSDPNSSCPEIFVIVGS